MPKNSPLLARILKNIPHQPGVYKMKNQAGEIIYIGKAKNLKKRVSSYFLKTKSHSVWTRAMVNEIADIEYVVSRSELEALCLEMILIQEKYPKYNIIWKDDKNFVYIKISKEEDFPRISLVRRVLKDGARYFGPKMSALAARESLDLARQLFAIRNCNLEMKELAEARVEVTKKTMPYPCLEYHIKRCIGPCISKCTKVDYSILVEQIISFFEGKTDFILKDLQLRMRYAATNRQFELAARLRDKWQAVKNIQEKQIVSVPENTNRDGFGYFIDTNNVYFTVLTIRQGRLIDTQNFTIAAINGMPETEIMAGFLKLYYEKAVDFPKEILLPIEIFEPDIFEVWFSEQKNSKVKLVWPRRGEKNQLKDLAMKNADFFAKQCQAKWQAEEEKTTLALQALAKALKLSPKINRLECFDISHLGGQASVASMVVFEKGRPKTSDYRHFKLKTTEGEINDVKSMTEVLQRRYRYLMDITLERSLGQQKLFLRKGRDKDLLFIKKKINEEGLDATMLLAKSFFVLEKDGKIIGFGRIQSCSGNLEKLASMWIDKTYRGQGLGRFLGQKLLEKAKTKRIYLACLEKNRGFYEQIGFREIYTIPSIFNKQTCPACQITGVTPIYMVYEKKKIDSSFSAWPDLIVVDGGKGQLNAALAVLKKFNLDLPVVALAKRDEEIFLPNKSRPVLLPKDSKARHLIQRLRDEAHRFAITHNQNLRTKKLAKSSLDKIPGIGSKIKAKLLKQFGSIYDIKKASVDELAKVVGHKMAERIMSDLD